MYSTHILHIEHYWRDREEVQQGPQCEKVARIPEDRGASRRVADRVKGWVERL
jgi:hypothetical protein